MSGGVELWNEFVAAGVRDSRRLDELLGGLPIEDSPALRAPLTEAAVLTFSIATQSLLMGAEPVGRLALASVPGRLCSTQERPGSRAVPADGGQPREEGPTRVPLASDVLAPNCEAYER